MRPNVEVKYLVALLLLTPIAVGCQLSKLTFGRFANNDGSNTQRVVLADAAQTTLDPSVDVTANNRSSELLAGDRSAINSASKRIDGSMTSALNNDVPVDEYNFSSHGAANYRTVAKVVPSKAGGCSSGCSH